MRASLLLASCLLALAPLAHADSFQYSINADTSSGTLHFDLTSPTIITSSTEFNGTPSDGYSLIRIIPTAGSFSGCGNILQAACVQIYTFSSPQLIELDFGNNLTGVYNPYQTLPAQPPYGANGSLYIRPTDSATAPTPEPSSLALLGTGLLASVGAVRRRLS